jgi:SAM-dependent methyltransferase
VRPLAGSRLLDVGSAHGWFLQAARAHGADAVGIEPDPAIASASAQRGHSVRIGWFPQVLEDHERFDVITFNDVLEHIPDVVGALDACARHLEPDGVLSVNLPTSDGLAYRTSARLARLGVYGPFERLWQHGLPSPHVHYFPRAAIASLLQARGLCVRYVGPLQAVVREGLWQRIHVYRRATPASAIGYAAILGAAPILNARPFCDIVHLVAQPRGGAADARAVITK